MAGQSLDDLNANFGLDGILRFEQAGELIRAQVTLPTCSATIYLQGAHLTAWQPTEVAPVLFSSQHSAFVPGKAIRGGIPICFPWFGGRSDGGPGPSHGFARTSLWQLAFAALLPDQAEGDRLQMTFVLGPSDQSIALGYADFRVAYELLLGRSLKLRLTVGNAGLQPLHFEEALHAYFSVGDVRQATVSGLEGATYLDKRDEGQSKQAPASPLKLTEWTDRIFPASTASLTLSDQAQARSIAIEKQNSATTVIWNPWADGTAALADLGDDEWPHFLCAEVANTGTDAITLAPGEAHTMAATISLRLETA